MSNAGINLCQFTISPVIGMPSLDNQPNTIPCQLNPSTSATIITAGMAVKLVSATANQIIVDVTSGPSDGPVFGIIPFQKQRNSGYSPGDQIGVFARGNTLFLKSGGAINRGVPFSVTNQSVSTNDPTINSDTTSGDYIAGITLGSASAAGQDVLCQVSPGLLGANGVITVTP